LADEPRWLTLAEILDIHADQIARHGGLDGVRMIGLVESAVENPRNLHHYDGEDDLLVLAVRFGLAIARNHGFNDGNKRAGAAAMLTFLLLNGHFLAMDDDTSLGRLIEGVLEGVISEAEFVEDVAPFVVEV
jgi:death-on-curing protein